MEDVTKDMSREELLELAESEGAEFKRNWGKDRIMVAITRAREAKAAARLEMMERASRLGIHVPDDWTNEQLAEILDAIKDAGDAPAAPVEYRGASPRG